MVNHMGSEWLAWFERDDDYDDRDDFKKKSNCNDFEQNSVKSNKQIGVSGNLCSYPSR